MNDFFLEKVESHKSRCIGGNIDVTGCQKTMFSKKCSLELSFVSVKKVEEFISCFGFLGV